MMSHKSHSTSTHMPQKQSKNAITSVKRTRHRQSEMWHRQFNIARLAVRVVVTICLTLGVLGILGSTAPVSHAQETTTLNANVYHSPDCNCCGGWMDHLKAQGFKIKDILTVDIDAVKQKYKVPDNLTSCHTAIVDGYVIEGHVPANDIKRLLQQKPNVVGLSVPNMPVGTPGMEMGNKKDPYTVFSFDSKSKVAAFNKYSAS